MKDKVFCSVPFIFLLLWFAFESVVKTVLLYVANEVYYVVHYDPSSKADGRIQSV